MKFTAEALKKLESVEIFELEIKVTGHLCDSCGLLKETQFTPDPFLEDIGNAIRWDFLCEECYRASCDDI